MTHHPEFFRFGPYHFDIADLLDRIEAGTLPYQESDWSIVEWAERSLGLDRAHPERRPVMLGAGIDYDYLPVVDAERLKVPLLLAITDHGTMLIDGRHRLAKAYLSGIDVLRARLIDPGIKPATT
jgi:hypothetical protein